MRFVILFFCSFSLYGQYFDTISVANKLKFVNYLKENKQGNDALYFLRYVNSDVQIDSLKLLEVKLLLELKREKDADTLLVKTTFQDSSSLKCSSRLLQNHIHLLLGKVDELTEPGCINHPTHNDIWRIQLLSSRILKNKTDDFDVLFNSGKSSDPTLSLVEFDLYVHHHTLLGRHKKSPFLAGLMSALLPGSGKIYAGKPHEALGAFLPVAFNGVQAAEGYYYKQFESPHFYFFSAAGSIFYASNIVGSVRAAKRKNQEFSDKIKTSIEFELAKLIKYY